MRMIHIFEKFKMLLAVRVAKNDVFHFGYSLGTMVMVTMDDSGFDRSDGILCVKLKELLEQLFTANMLSAPIASSFHFSVFAVKSNVYFPVLAWPLEAVMDIVPSSLNW